MKNKIKTYFSQFSDDSFYDLEFMENLKKEALETKENIKNRFSHPEDIKTFETYWGEIIKILATRIIKAKELLADEELDKKLKIL